MRKALHLLGFLSLLVSSSCLKTSEYETWYYLSNESGVDMQMQRYSGAAGAWDENFKDSIDTLDFPLGMDLGFHYPSTGALLLPFGGTDSLVFTSGDSIRLLYTPLSPGKNPFWPGSYSGGFINEDDWVLYHEYRFRIYPEDLPGADSLEAG